MSLVFSALLSAFGSLKLAQETERSIKASYELYNSQIYQIEMVINQICETGTTILTNLNSKAVESVKQADNSSDQNTYYKFYTVWEHILKQLTGMGIDATQYHIVMPSSFAVL